MALIGAQTQSPLYGLQTANITPSQYGVTIAPLPAYTTFLPGEYVHSEWLTVDQAEGPTQQQYPTLTSSIPQFGEWPTFHWDSAPYLLPYPSSDTQSSGSGSPPALPPTPLSRVPGCRGYNCPDCGNKFKSKQSTMKRKYHRSSWML